MRNVSVPYNFNGTDLIPRLCLETPSKLKIFLYGGTEEANMKASQTLSARYPTVEMVGRVNGYVDQDGVAPMIAASQADLLLVCLGNPLQEIYLAENRDKFGVKVALGVGGLVDFLSAVKPRAPDWMRRFGLEWVFRLGLEPKRMAKRYLVGNPLFLFRCLTALGSDKKLQDIIMNEVEAPR